MGEIINLEERIKRPLDNLITLSPWEFRKSDWGSLYFIQMFKTHSDKFERTRLRENTCSLSLYFPSHILLTGSASYSIRAIYACRENEEKMREVYYLIGLIDCMINRVNPILRTDLLRDMYKKIRAIKKKFAVNWHGPLDQVLLPIDPGFFDESAYSCSLNGAGTMKELYYVIRKGTDEMFDVFSKEYVFYCPDVGV